MGHVISLPSGSTLSVHPPEWEGPRPPLPGEDTLYYMEFTSMSGSSYVYSRDRDPNFGEFPDFHSFCEELVREGYVHPDDVPSVVEFLERDPESFSLAASVVLS